MSVGGAPPKQMRERERERRKWPNALLLALMCAALVYSCISYYRGAHRLIHRLHQRKL